MKKVFIPREDIFSGNQKVRNTYSKIIKPLLQENNSYNIKDRIVYSHQIDEIVDVLCQESVQNKIVDHIQDYREKLLKNFDKTIGIYNQVNNHLSVDENYFESLRNLIKEYPYQINLKNKNFDLNTINLVKDLGNNFFYARFIEEGKTGLIFLKKEGNILEQYGVKIFFDENSNYSSEDEKSLKILCDNLGECAVVHTPSFGYNHFFASTSDDSHFFTSTSDDSHFFTSIGYGKKDKHVIFSNKKRTKLLNIDDIPKTQLEPLNHEQQLMITEKYLYTFWITLGEIDGIYPLQGREVASFVNKRHKLLLRKARYKKMANLIKEIFPKYGGKDHPYGYDYKVVDIKAGFGKFSEIPIKSKKIQKDGEFYYRGDIAFKNRELCQNNDEIK